MFRFAKKTIKSYSLNAVEHIIGIVLSDRSRYLNYGLIAENNIYSGLAIGSLFQSDQKRLDDEFDCIAIHFTFSVLEGFGVSDDYRRKALEIVLDNFDIDKSYRYFLSKRLAQYAPLDNRTLAAKLIENLAVKDFPERFQAESDRILGQQFDAFEKYMRRYIKAELEAKVS